MAQRLKPEVRARIVDAATDQFALEGYAGATVASISRRAGLSTGNVYRYFGGKSELFAAVVDDAFADQFTALLEARVGALTALDDLRALDPAAVARQGELLAFWIAHRRRVVILLDRCAGTAHAEFGERFVARLVQLTVARLEARVGGALPPHTTFVLGRVFDGTRRTLVAILEQHESEAEIRAAFAAFWSFQLAGLAGFERGVVR